MSQDFGEIGNLAADTITGGYTSGQRAAKAQGDIAKANLEQQQGDRALALSFAEASPEELAQLNRSIALNEADITRKQKLLDSSDPALIEAGEQALKLLKGEEAKTLGPLKAQFDQQESELRSKLAAQLGPGYENTTAGIQALEAFNQQKNSVYANAQQNALGALLGVAQNTSANYGTQQNLQNSGTLAQLFGNIQGRKINALTGSPITNAGAGFVGDLMSARENTKWVNRAYEAAAAVASGGTSLLATGAPGSSGTGGGSKGFAGNPYTD